MGSDYAAPRPRRRPPILLLLLPLLLILLLLLLFLLLLLLLLLKPMALKSIETDVVDTIEMFQPGHLARAR